MVHGSRTTRDLRRRRPRDSFASYFSTVGSDLRQARYSNVMAALACRRSWITVIPTPAACFRRTFASASTRKSYDPPESPTFYTGRARYYDYLANLERAIHHTRQTLKTFQLDPLPEFARKSLPLASSAWLNKDDMANSLSSKLSSTRHRRLLELLDTLNNFRRIATAAGHENLAQNISTVLEIFERKDKLTVTSRTRKNGGAGCAGAYIHDRSTQNQLGACVDDFIRACNRGKGAKRSASSTCHRDSREQSSSE